MACTSMLLREIRSRSLTAIAFMQVRNIVHDSVAVPHGRRKHASSDSTMYMLKS